MCVLSGNVHPDEKAVRRAALIIVGVCRAASDKGRESSDPPLPIIRGRPRDAGDRV
jgi:hypothetical protein